MRIVGVHNVPIACNRSTADFLLSSPLMQMPYERLVMRPLDSRPIPSVAVET